MQERTSVLKFGNPKSNLEQDKQEHDQEPGQGRATKNPFPTKIRRRGTDQERTQDPPAAHLCSVEAAERQRRRRCGCAWPSLPPRHPLSGQRCRRGRRRRKIGGAPPASPVPRRRAQPPRTGNLSGERKTIPCCLFSCGWRINGYARWRWYSSWGKTRRWDDGR